MNLLQDKVAIVTGATRGIGRAIALKFALEGCQVAFCGRERNSRMIEVEAELQAFGIQAKGYAVDVSDYQAALDFVNQVKEDFGHIDILVNNAGITADAALKRMTEQQWDDVIRVNLRSLYCMTKAIQPIFWKQAKGSIVNISSVVGIAGNANQCNYAAAKAGIIGFSKSIAKEFGVRGIRCNVVAPGFIETEMTQLLPPEKKAYWCQRIPLRRAGTIEEVANACLYYASDLSTYNTGDVMHLCGGMEDA